jgi:hypothetical protein
LKSVHFINLFLPSPTVHSTIISLVITAASSTMVIPFGSPAIFSEPLWYSRGASPYYNQSHEKLRAEVRQYMDTSITPFAEEWEKDGSVPTDVCPM